MGRVLVQQPGTNTAKALTETLPKNVIIVDEDLKELRLHDGVTPGGKIIGQSAGSGVPIGTIIPFAGNSVPQGYLLCDGSAISRTDYASLFAVIGTIYGAGDGNSTFNLPNASTGGGGYILKSQNNSVTISNNGGRFQLVDESNAANINGLMRSTDVGAGSGRNNRQAWFWGTSTAGGQTNPNAFTRYYSGLSATSTSSGMWIQKLCIKYI